MILNGTEVNRLKEKELSAFRNQQIGFVFQFHQLLPEFTALENVMIPAFISGASSGDAMKRAKETLDFLGLAERRFSVSRRSCREERSSALLWHAH